jgi:two-component system sensor histidine kinase HydH
MQGKLQIVLGYASEICDISSWRESCSIVIVEAEKGEPLKNTMMKGAAIALGVVCFAVAGVIYISLELMQRDHRTLIDQFSEKHLAQIDEITQQLEQNFQEIGRTLRAAGELTQRTNSREEMAHDLGIFMTPLANYFQLQRYDTEGALLLSVQNPTTQPIIATNTAEATAETVSAALTEGSGEVQMSVPLRGAKSGWHRIFSVVILEAGQRPAGAIAALIDTQSIFQKAKILTAESESQLLILSTRGRATPATYPPLAKALEELDSLRSQLPQYAELVTRMKSGEHGILRISANEAMLLSLGSSEVIVTYGPIRVGSGHWSAATLTSTASLQKLESAIQLRFGLAAALISLFLVAFGVYVVRASRREILIGERLKHAEHLAHLHEKTEKILDQIPTGVLVLSETGQITALNRHLQERLPSTAIGSHLSVCFSEAPAAVVTHLQSLLNAAQTQGQVKSSFSERLSLFGEEGLYNLHAVPLEHPDPEARLLLVIEDVSKVSQLESQLLRAEKLSTVGVLAAGIAHEVGTPLGVVRWRAENILSKLGDQDPQAPGVKVIIEQIDHVTRIIRQLLDFSRIRPAQVQPIALKSVASEVEALLRYEGERRKIKLHLEIPTELPLIAADRTQLQQVLVNLLLNAYDACPDGGIVSFVARQESDPQSAWRRIRMEVSDTGCGIPTENRNQVFDPFFTTKKRGAGTGLGLTIAAQIVRDHGGRIELESESGKGTRLILYWPTAPEQAHEVMYDS